MSDEALRSLERAALEGDPQARLRHFVACLRAGRLRPEQIQLAGLLGGAEFREALGERAPEPFDSPFRWIATLHAWPDAGLLRLGIAAGRRLLAERARLGQSTSAEAEDLEALEGWWREPSWARAQALEPLLRRRSATRRLVQALLFDSPPGDVAGFLLQAAFRFHPEREVAERFAGLLEASVPEALPFLLTPGPAWPQAPGAFPQPCSRYRLEVEGERGVLLREEGAVTEGSAWSSLWRQWSFAEGAELVLIHCEREEEEASELIVFGPAGALLVRRPFARGAGGPGWAMSARPVSRTALELSFSQGRICRVELRDRPRRWGRHWLDLRWRPELSPGAGPLRGPRALWSRLLGR